MMAILLVFMLPARALAQADTYVDTYDPATPQDLKDGDLRAKAALVMDAETGTVLYDKNGDRQTYPASTTKIMTCLVALENTPDLNALVHVGQESQNIPLDSSKTGISPGEQISMIDLLYGMMMKSGNDAAMTVAVAVGGTVDHFVEMMNTRAREIGCQNTHFVNPHGYHDQAHVSTAHDLALIARVAMQNRTFREIVSAKSYTMAATNLREKKRLETSNAMYVSSSPYYYPDLVGIKTGFHSKAGQCFVGAADKDGTLIISVVLKSIKEDKRDAKWTDTARLIDYADTRYVSYSFEQLLDKAPVYASIENAARSDENAGLVRLTVVPGSTLGNYRVRFLPELEEQTLAEFARNLTVNYTSDLKAPITSGDILGTASMVKGTETLTATVIASRDVALEAKPFTMGSMMPNVQKMFKDNTVLIVVGVLLLIIAIILIIKMRAAARNRRRRREMLRRRRAAYDRYRMDR
ncbi:MAG: D-alanyl-D-alanine carboxypeptidase family protein [Clostridia bacterium]